MSQGVDDTSLIFTLDEHVERSMAALPAIHAQLARGIDERVTCHHFEFLSGGEFEDKVTPAEIALLTERLDKLGIEFDLPLLEAADWVIPDRAWIERTVPKLFEIARSAGLNYAGWTWEPLAIQPIGSTAFPVINNRSMPSTGR